MTLRFSLSAVYLMVALCVAGAAPAAADGINEKACTVVYGCAWNAQSKTCDAACVRDAAALPPPDMDIATADSGDRPMGPVEVQDVTGLTYQKTPTNTEDETPEPQSTAKQTKQTTTQTTSAQKAKTFKFRQRLRSHAQRRADRKKRTASRLASKALVEADADVELAAAVAVAAPAFTGYNNVAPITYSWEVESNLLGGGNDNTGNPRNFNFFVAFYRPRCWRAGHADNGLLTVARWTQLSLDARRAIVAAVRDKLPANAGAVDLVLQGLANAATAPATMTVAEAAALGASCNAELAALPVGVGAVPLRRYSFEYFDLNRHVSRPVCWNPVHAANGILTAVRWERLSQKAKLDIVAAVRDKLPANAGAVDLALQGLANAVTAPATMTVAEAAALGASCNAELAALPVGGAVALRSYGVAYFHHVNNEIVPLRVNGGDRPRAIADSNSWLYGYVFPPRTRWEGIVDMMSVAASHAHQETGANTYEFMVSGYLSEWARMKYHIRTMKATDKLGHMHVVFPMPTPFNDGPGVNAVLRSRVVALALYQNDLAAIAMYSAIAPADFMHPYICVPNSATGANAYNEMTAAEIPAGGYEMTDANGARVGRMKFTFVALRYGIYTQPADGLNRFGFEMRTVPGRRHRAWALAVSETMRQIGAATVAHPTVELFSGVKVRIEDLVTESTVPQGALTNTARGLSELGMIHFEQRLTGAGLVAAAGRWNADVAAFIDLVKAAVAEAGGVSAAHPGNLNQACGFVHNLWNAANCQTYYDEIIGRIAVCFHSGADVLPRSGMFGMSNPNAGRLATYLGRLENVLHTALAHVDLTVPRAGTQVWGDTMLQSIYTRVVRPACTHTLNFITDEF